MLPQRMEVVKPRDAASAVLGRSGCVHVCGWIQEESGGRIVNINALR